jgi:hypothetical protein
MTYCTGSAKASFIYIYIYIYIYLFIYLFLTAIGLTPSGRVVQYTFTNSTQNAENGIYITIKRKKIEKCGPSPVFASDTLAFALQVRKKHGKTSVRLVEEFACKSLTFSRCKGKVRPRTSHEGLEVG